MSAPKTPPLDHELWFARAVMGTEWDSVFAGLTTPAERARRLKAYIDRHGMYGRALGKRGDTVGEAYARLYGVELKERAAA